MPTPALAETFEVDYTGTDLGFVYYVDSSGEHTRETSMPIYFPDNKGNVYHCIEPHKEFMVGTHTSQDASRILSQGAITKLGMSNEWCKSTSNVPKAQRHILEQVFMWKILHEYNFGRDGQTTDFLLEGYDSTAAYRRFNTWYNENKDRYEGHGVILTNSTDGTCQRIGRFWANKVTGTFFLRKGSALDSLTGGNACYSLGGACYGLYRDEACTQGVGAEYDLVTGDDGVSNTVELPIGTYWIKEKTAPRGFAIDTQAHPLELQVGENDLSLVDNPLYESPDLWVTKRDAQMGGTQGEATFEGAQYTVRYYDGFYNTENLPANATRTWVMATNRDGRITASNQQKVGGDPFYQDSDGKIVFPLGTIAIQETQAPSGYLLEGQTKDSPANYAAPVHVCTVTGEGSFVSTLSNELVIRGGVAVGKVSRETNDHVPQGEATLAGAVFSITYDSGADAANVLVEGKEYARGSEVKRIVTDESGIASTSDDLLPYGKYTVREIAQPTGYLPNREWSHSFQILQNGVVVDLTSEQDSVDDQVIRGGFHFNKTDERTMERMSNSVFAMTSTSTGESHILVADENGIVDTESVAHSHHTNANDDAVSEEGMVDESKLTSDAGVWFSGRSDVQTSPNDQMLALPYDVYTIAELRSAANEGRELVTFTVRVHRHDQSVDLGTVDDPTIETPEPHMATTLTFNEDQHVAPVGEQVTLVDHVRYEGLEPNQEYCVVGRLVFSSDGSPVTNAQGDPVQEEVTFTPLTSFGEVEVIFVLDSSALENQDVVAFEQLMANGEVVCSHEDLEDAAQTIHFPSIGTTLADKEGNHEICAGKTVTLVDTVSYHNLISGHGYELVGTLMDKESGEALLDASDAPIESRTSFVAEKDGTATVTFVVDANVVQGKSVVAFERLQRDGICIASHEDIDDGDQTVSVPFVSTSLTEGQYGHEVPATEETRLVDVVSYQGLTPGTTYQLQGRLVDKKSGEPITGGQDDAVTSNVSFVAESASGTVEIPFTLSTAALAGRSAVAFEQLSAGEGKDARIVATHEDLEAAEQTVWFPRIQTNACDAADKDKEIAPTGTAKIIDTVTYTNLTPGNTYVMRGTLYDKGTGEPLRGEDGNPVTTETTVVPEERDGSVDLEFSFDASRAQGKAIVAFERCMRDDLEVATHANIDDQDQTVFIIDRQTVQKASKVKPTTEQTSKTSSTPQSTAQSTAHSASGGNPSTGDTSLSAIVFLLMGILSLGAAVAYIFHKQYERR
ncbi:MAG: VaFE repeat-containing surface-anchored protein [Coriobacteriales bacterium]|nr:VaFE repeat-containing surface-anchored protein [Coriobacteriales bacterium]